jgi:hypothetical protein
MTTAPSTLASPSIVRAGARCFYVGMAVLAILFSFVAFGPSMMKTSQRLASLTGLLAAHGVVFFAWLLVFLAQSSLVRTGRLALHRQIGMLSAILAAAMVVLGYRATIAMARRGFDMSGDLAIQSDPLAGIAFPLLDIAMFTVLFVAAYLYRCRPAIHKRLMLLAVFGGLMPAPIAHLTGYYAFFHDKPLLTPLIVGAFLAVSAIHDRIVLRRIHPVSLWVALAMFTLDNLCAAVVMPSPAWHALASRLIR